MKIAFPLELPRCVTSTIRFRPAIAAHGYGCAKGMDTRNCGGVVLFVGGKLGNTTFCRGTSTIGAPAFMLVANVVVRVAVVRVV